MRMPGFTAELSAIESTASFAQRNAAYASSVASVHAAAYDRHLLERISLIDWDCWGDCIKVGTDPHLCAMRCRK